MKKQIAKIVSLLIIVVMVFTGCSKGSGNKSGDENKTPETGTDNNSTEAPLDLKVMVWDRGDAAPGTTIEENALTEWIKEQILADINVNVTFQAVSRATTDDNIQMMMAGGTAPDIILTYDRTIFGSFAVDGGLTDLSDAITKYGDVINTELASILDVGKIDGVQYAIPAKRQWQKVRHIGMIRKDWLDALGLEVPKTKEELIAALYAFKEQDPGKLGDKLVPWAMSGDTSSEKMYLNFVASYAEPSTEEDTYVYSEWTKALDTGAEEGFKVLNKLYNDGIISKDFAVDTDSSIYQQAISNGQAGFFLDDAQRPMAWITTAQELNPEVEYVAINAFEDSLGAYVNPANPLYGAYIMVPKASEAKVEAAVKYINWMANPENAIKVYYTPDYQADENGIPVTLTEDEKYSKGYPLTPADFCIATQYWAYYNDPATIVKSLKTSYPTFSEEYLTDLYTQITTGMTDTPVIQQILEEESVYSSNVKSSTIIYAYNLISAAPGTFDEIQKTKYAELVQAGLDKILEARANYYKDNVAK
ncbi:hypothetical protein acsn021_43340 [Anaerocolumna cellulosilytica]|uniref:Uncharacterized protein n=1 Tax=Anaerocolumna cellulosilytica TaxID=433286 RepID=A0A6S6RCP9_9FIRM|nr:extracellular solute-binding protein [Anaerocolumna cellulosilytica]MBB5195292.1 putative aldouronate transport system substrate-binding protein [Anaerocolumna cellulosilytica]BCJ96765.1 hypothetical protein acsn021_43340 [Anaerocolumna cellulosilytica]